MSWVVVVPLRIRLVCNDPTLNGTAMASAGDNRLAAARLMTVAAPSRLSPATRGSQNSYTACGDTIYIEACNREPRPFRWTKSADDILASIERFCRRTLILHSETA